MTRDLFGSFIAREVKYLERNLTGLNQSARRERRQLRAWRRKYPRRRVPMLRTFRRWMGDGYDLIGDGLR